MMCETEDQKLAKDVTPGGEVAMELENSPGASAAKESPESFDLYQWALDFSRAAGFEFDPVDATPRG